MLHLKQNLSIKPFGASGVESYFVIFFSYAVSYDFKGIAHIAQLVEHFLGKEEVTGSNPVMSSNLSRRLKVFVRPLRRSKQ